MKRYPLGRFFTDPPGVNRSRSFTSSCKLIKNGSGGGCQVLEISYKQFDIVSQSSCRGSSEQQEESFICQLYKKKKKKCFLGGEPRLLLHRARQRTQASVWHVMQVLLWASSHESMCRKSRLQLFNPPSSWSALMLLVPVILLHCNYNKHYASKKKLIN